MIQVDLIFFTIMDVKGVLLFKLQSHPYSFICSVCSEAWLVGEIQMFTYARRDLVANFHKDNFDEDLLSPRLDIRKISNFS